jgi:hypothetical protein
VRVPPGSTGGDAVVPLMYREHYMYCISWPLVAGKRDELARSDERTRKRKRKRDAEGVRPGGRARHPDTPEVGGW